MIVPIWLGLGFLMFVLEWLARVFKVTAPASTVLLMYAYKIPSHLHLVFPLAVLISAMIVLGSLNRNREAVAAQSLGLSIRSMVIPCLVAATLVGMANYWVMDNLAPVGMRKYYELEDEHVRRVPSRFLRVRQDKIWYRNRDILYNVGHFSPSSNVLYDVTIFSFDSKFQISQTIFAEKAVWGDGVWRLTNGTISITDPQLTMPLARAFKEKNTRLIENPKALKRVDFNADIMSQSELFKAIKRHHALGINTAKWEVLFHSRLSFFMIAFVFLILSVPLTLRFSRSDSGVGRDATFVSGVCLLYWLIFNFSVNMGNSGKLPPIIAAWGPSIVFLVGGIFYLNTLNLKSLGRG